MKATIILLALTLATSTMALAEQEKSVSYAEKVAIILNSKKSYNLSAIEKHYDGMVDQLKISAKVLGSISDKTFNNPHYPNQKNIARQKNNLINMEVANATRRFLETYDPCAELNDSCKINNINDLASFELEGEFFYLFVESMGLLEKEVSQYNTPIIKNSKNNIKSFVKLLSKKGRKALKKLNPNIVKNLKNSKTYLHIQMIHSLAEFNSQEQFYILLDNQLLAITIDNCVAC